MKITIDTNTDSANDIKDVISLLQNVLRNRGHNVLQSNSSFEQSNATSLTPEKKLARKIAKAKARIETQEVPMTISSNSSAEKKEEAPVFFDMFSSNESTTVNQNNQDINKKQNRYDEYEEEYDSSEPKIEIIPYS